MFLQDISSIQSRLKDKNRKSGGLLTKKRSGASQGEYFWAICYIDLVTVFVRIYLVCSGMSEICLVKGLGRNFWLDYPRTQNDRNDALKPKTLHAATHELKPDSDIVLSATFL